jgi:hypothetical protein
LGWGISPESSDRGERLAGFSVVNATLNSGYEFNQRASAGNGESVRKAFAGEPSFAAATASPLAAVISR